MERLFDIIKLLSYYELFETFIEFLKKQDFKKYPFTKDMK